MIPTAVLSFVHPDAVDLNDLRGSFCRAVNFLADPTAAERWSTQASDRLILDLGDAFRLAQRLFTSRCGCCTPEANSLR